MSGYKEHNGSADLSLGEVTKRLSDAASRLVRKEAELAKTELSEKARSMAVGAGLAIGAWVLALAALVALTAAAILALATTIASWLAAPIVGIAVALVAGALCPGRGQTLAESCPACAG